MSEFGERYEAELLSNELAAYDDEELGGEWLGGPTPSDLALWEGYKREWAANGWRVCPECQGESALTGGWQGCERCHDRGYLLADGTAAPWAWQESAWWGDGR